MGTKIERGGTSMPPAGIWPAARRRGRCSPRRWGMCPRDGAWLGGFAFVDPMLFNPAPNGRRGDLLLDRNSLDPIPTPGEFARNRSTPSNRAFSLCRANRDLPVARRRNILFFGNLFKIFWRQ